MAAIIDRAIAKEELARINAVLKEPHLLIGGLAVQQYHVSRDSKDIDLICGFETADEIVEQLYPSNDWDVKNKLHDDYRPSYQIICRFEDRGIIIFGPKISERTPYVHLNWDSLKEGAIPFDGPEGKLANILVPTAAALAYTKFISFLGRNPASGDKIKQDLKDFMNLTNQNGFSAAEFNSLLKRTKAYKELCTAFQERCSNYNYRKIIEQSCLHEIATIIYETATLPTALPSKFSTMKTVAVVYVAAPHKNKQQNKGIKKALEDSGFDVRIPYDEVAKHRQQGKPTTPKAIREICINAINESQFVVVDLDTYGLDTAWELGYAEGLGKRVIGYNQDVFLTTDARTVNRRLYEENFMHGWHDQLNQPSQPVFTDIALLTSTCKDKSVYIAGSFSNAAAEEQVSKALDGNAKTVILPKKYIDDQRLLPKDYPLAERGETNQLLDSADIVLVVLPRYGMDSSWQIGYATAKQKTLMGIVLEDDNIHKAEQSFWDHWMHGWKNKVRVTGAAELCSVLNGFWNYQ